ncbi:MAG: hypothetical protein DYH15_09300 [Nitrosomonas sp. PRO4]|nr:hypothetical protein [Nitrosomonas sp. PRO4]
MYFKAMINSEGELQKVDGNLHVDATISAPLNIIPELVTQKATALKQIMISGDESLAEELIDIGKQINISMIIEQDLSQLFGDMIAHRIVHGGQYLIQWQTKNFDQISRAITEYYTEENVLLTKRTTVNQWSNEIAKLKNNIEKLERRLDKLLHALS